MLAVHFGHIEMVKLLLQHQPRLDHRNSARQHSALHLACKGHRLDLAALLIEHGANCFLVDADGCVCWDLIKVQHMRDKLLEYVPWLRRRRMILFIRGSFRGRYQRRTVRAPSTKVFFDIRLVNLILSYM